MCTYVFVPGKVDQNEWGQNADGQGVLINLIKQGHCPLSIT